jgi:DNA-binding GntR family transcriptional regulator
MPREDSSVLIHPVYLKLREMITRGEFSPGEKLVQEKLATRLGVSRTPLVKALQILEQDMLVVSIPRRGMYVRQISTDDLLAAYECRQAIETTAVRLATNRITMTDHQKLKRLFEPFLNSKQVDFSQYLIADAEFHQQLVVLSGNDYLMKMNQIASIYKQTYVRGLIRPPDETLPEHLRILSAMETKDAALAEEYMRNHIRKSIITITEAFKEETSNKVPRLK